MAEEAKKPKKLTIPEFKSWLEGLLDLQPDDWAPTLDQWKKIKAKISQLDNFDAGFERHVALMIERVVANIRMPVMAAQQANGGPPLPTQAGWNPWTIQQPTGQEVAPPPQVQQVAPVAPVQPVVMPGGGSSLTGASAATPATLPNLPPGVMTGNLDPRNAIKIEPAQTPHIDTSSGSYKSGYL